MDASILGTIAIFWLVVGLLLTVAVWFFTDRFLPWLIVGWPLLIFALLFSL